MAKIPEAILEMLRSADTQTTRSFPQQFSMMKVGCLGSSSQRQLLESDVYHVPLLPVPNGIGGAASSEDGDEWYFRKRK